MLWPATTSAQEIVKTTIRPFEFKTLTELYANKDWKKRMSNTKKQGRYEQVIPVTLPDGNPGMMCHTSSGGYILRDSTGTNKYDGFVMTETNIESINGKDYLQLIMRPTSKYALYTMDGKTVLYEGLSYRVLKAGKHIIFWRPYYNEYFNSEGTSILYGGDDATKTSIHYVPEVKPEMRTVYVENDSIEMLCSATPEFLYLNSTYNGKYIYYEKIKDFEGKDLFKGLTWNMAPFPTEETGYYIITRERPSLEIKEVNREVGGEIIPYRCLALKNNWEVGELLDCHGMIVKRNGGIEYSSPDHSITYRTKENGRYLKGAIFLRDSTLNVPPLFTDVMYKFDETGKTWKPYVRRSLFGPSEPYVTGMDTTPDFRNSIERDIEYNKINMSELEERYGEGHKWDERDLAYVNYLATANTFWLQSVYEYKPWLSQSISETAKNGKKFIETANNSTFIHDYIYAQRIYEKAKTNYKGKGVPAMAEQLIALTQKKKQDVQEWVDYQTNLFNLAIEQNEKNAKEEEGHAAVRERQSAMARAATKARQRAKENDNAANLLIMTAVMRSVNKTLGNIFGGNKPRVTYTGNGNGSYNVPANTGGTGTSSGGAVNTAQKCGRCNGTGACSACHGHPGKATSAKNSPNCHGCGGNGRCTYCGGSGYKR